MILMSTASTSPARSAARIYYTDQFVLPLPDGHRFPMERYALLRQAIIDRKIAPRGWLAPPEAATDEQLQLVHTASYLRRVAAGELSRDEVRRIGFPWSPQLVERSRRSVGATIAAAESAEQVGLGINLAGGTHHAFADRGAGYCLYNDIAVAIRTRQRRGKIRRAIVLDVDVHQGDGTAAIFNGDASVFTASLHAAAAFPAKKQQSDLDVALPRGASDEVYLAALDELLSGASRAGSFDVAFCVAGADPYLGDRLGGLAVSKAGLAERDRRLFAFCQSLGWPVVLVMAGGYARNVSDIVEIQAETVRSALAHAAWRR